MKSIVFLGFMCFQILLPGNHNEGATPVPIPNTEVKPFSADGTAPGAEWESRSLPGFFYFYPKLDRMITIEKRMGENCVCQGLLSLRLGLSERSDYEHLRGQLALGSL